jgi:hypothetical protein
LGREPLEEGERRGSEAVVVVAGRSTGGVWPDRSPIAVSAARGRLRVMGSRLDTRPAPLRSRVLGLPEPTSPGEDGIRWSSFRR